MIDIAIKFLLLSVPGLPLLLAIPALRCRLPWPAHVALLPAIVLLFIPGSLYIDLPWIFWGSFGMGIDTGSRWWLAMSVLIWVVSAAFLNTPGGHGACNRLTSLFLITLAGQMGAILATDMVSFFTFMTLMGYAFFGLLVVDGDEQARRAGRIYLVFLILADIALFEALLIAAASTDDLRFAAVAHAITLSPSPALYLSMVIAGLALKAGFWPLHVWLPLAYGSSRPPVALLLWLVPVATGLLGAVRWLPLGEITAPIAGMLLQAIGAAGILYTMLFGMRRAQWKQLTAYVAIIATGIFAMGLGTGMVDPAIWNKYGADSVLAFVGTVGLGLAIMIASFAWLEKKRGSPPETRMSDGAEFWFERWQEAVINWGLRAGNDTLSGFHASWLARWGGFWQTRTWLKMFDAGEYF
ncbi:MAG: proton-conducting transporter membrane subunit, partial [Candidatus Nitrotoga sp.]